MNKDQYDIVDIFVYVLHTQVNVIKAIYLQLYKAIILNEYNSKQVEILNDTFC